MKYDLCIRITEESDIKNALITAKRLGWGGVGILAPQRKFFNLKEKFSSKNEDIDVVFGVYIKPKNTRDIRRLARKIRMKTEIVAVEGNGLDTSRAALETREVDILFLPWKDGKECMNYIMARLATKNNVSIAFNFNDILHSRGRSRTIVFSNMLSAAKLVRKFKSPFVITSGAQSSWDIRSPSDLIAFGRVLGFGDPEIKKAMSDHIIKENRKRLSDKWIMPGVEIEK